MAELPALIEDLALILVVAGVVTLLFKRLKQPLVLGYIVAGFLVSPHMPYTASVADMSSIHLWADIGVMFLLFSLGLDFSFKKILKMGASPVISVVSIIFFMSMLGMGNHIYKHEYFKLPVAYNFGSELVKIPGLDGSTKMSKSDNENSCIYLSDTPEVIRKKVMKAVSDSGPTEPGQPKSQAVENLFQLMKAVSTPETVQYFEDQYQNCAIRYGDMKKQLAADMTAFVQPVYERILELRDKDDYIRKVAREGAERARESAAKTVKEVREIIGIKSF